ncbi:MULTISPECIES: hypothetical protein [Actinosynnema]|uniref:hypothetical protein n=1 Tax=Actinosynnema TaxID=40566 RepID=UPI0020A4CC69|nr:hypothetical protein [Actinosynnema pretiosum]
MLRARRGRRDGGRAHHRPARPDAPFPTGDDPGGLVAALLAPSAHRTEVITGGCRPCELRPSPEDRDALR